MRTAISAILTTLHCVNVHFNVVTKLVERFAESGINMCDLGCSLGNTTLRIAQKFPKSQVHGADIGEDAIANAKKAANEKEVTNCHFHVADIANMPAHWTDK